MCSPLVTNVIPLVFEPSTLRHSDLNSEHVSQCFWTVAPISVVVHMFPTPTTHFHTFATPIDCLWAQEYVFEHPDLFLSVLNPFSNLLLIPYPPPLFSDLYHLFFDLHYSFSRIPPIFNPYHLPLLYITYFSHISLVFAHFLLIPDISYPVFNVFSHFRTSIPHIFNPVR